MRRTRRDFVRGCAALPVALSLSPHALADASDDARNLRAAIRDHMRYSAGFQRKALSGNYHAPDGDAPIEDVIEAYRSFGAMLRSSGHDVPTLSLIHWRDPAGYLHGFLLGPDGFIVSGKSEARYDSLAFLLDAMRVEARTAARAPIPRGTTRAPPPSAAGPSDIDAALTRARDLLFPGPIAETLASRSGRLLILPARDSGCAPYAALPLGDGQFIDRWSSVIMPDIEALGSVAFRWDASSRDVSKAIVVGNPDLSADPAYIWSNLPSAGDEARDFAKRFGVPQARTLIGAQATRSRVLSAIGQADIIYLATHGIANSVNPMDGSFLALSGGHLYGRDIRKINAGGYRSWHPFVILSACQTALGKTFDGGTFGVARAFYSAGASQVVASLWNVSDQATQFLMQRFAGYAFGEGKLPEQSLRLAQLDTRKLLASDPAAWASFSILGGFSYS